MRLIASPLDLPLASPFRISRSVQTIGYNVLLRLETGDDEGAEGLGEAAPSAYYGETRETVFAALTYFGDVLGEDPLLHEDILRAADRMLHHHAAAKAALDMALYDVVGNQLGLPLYRLLGLNPAQTPVTSYTIGIDSPAEMARKAAAAARDYPILKIKVGTPHDVEIVRAIREATDVTLRVDANAGWTAKQAIATINALAPYDIEFVEQPVAASDLEGLRLVRENVPVPVIADESCVTLEDIPRVADRADGINIKLMKCGGVAHALKMIAAARAHHLKIMLGCMAAESSLAITAAAHLSPLVDYADLDGPLLLATDPFEGVRYERGKLVLPDRSGLGVRRRTARRAATGAKTRRAQRDGAAPNDTPTREA
jgi:L-alanine-DL-glutamate epimerase-like enolase superfamily enzyme